MKVITTCAHCAAEFQIERGALNRANRRGAKVYCNRTCSGLGRRDKRTDAEKKQAKAEYDRKYRDRNREMLRRKKAEYFQRTYDPEAAAIERKERSKYHAEYCRRPEYRAWKKQYDRQYRAKKFYGEFWESFLLSLDIREHCLSAMSDHEIRSDKDGINKTQNRRRSYERTISKHLEIGPLGNSERR